MAFFMDPGAMFLGCLNGVEQKFLIELIKNARQSGYTRFVEPCAGTFAMSNLAVQSGFRPEQIETSDVNMMTSVMGYAITSQSLAPLEFTHRDFLTKNCSILLLHCMRRSICGHRRTRATNTSTTSCATLKTDERSI